MVSEKEKRHMKEFIGLKCLDECGTIFDGDIRWHKIDPGQIAPNPKEDYLRNGVGVICLECGKKKE